MFEEPQIIDRLGNTRFFTPTAEARVNTGIKEPDHARDRGEGALAMKLRIGSSGRGVRAGIAFLTAARDARVRTIVVATHTRGELQFALTNKSREGVEIV
jgi:hypothetical protein